MAFASNKNAYGICDLTGFRYRHKDLRKTWDGLLVPCCFDKDAKHVLGDLKTNSFKEIWKGNKYKGLRESIIKNRKGIDICTNCTEGMNIFESD